MPFIPSLLAIFRTVTQDRSDLLLENLALRQQIAVLQSNTPLPGNVEPPCRGRVVAIPPVGGLHHLYKRVA